MGVQVFWEEALPMDPRRSILERLPHEERVLADRGRSDRHEHGVDAPDRLVALVDRGLLPVLLVVVPLAGQPFEQQSEVSIEVGRGARGRRSGGQ
jgi:hypothetical protein